jgi:hypothetical protein
MHDPTEQDRPEILAGPGDVRLAEKHAGRSARPPKNKKTIAIAASVLVAVLAAGGAGYLLAASPSTPATQESGGRPAPSQSVGGDEALQDDDATVGDVATDAPENGLPDGGTGDTSADTGGDAEPAADTGATGTDPATGTDTARGTEQTGNGKNPAMSSPAKPRQTPAGDNPADGPAGEVTGQCAKSGC